MTKLPYRLLSVAFLLMGISVIFGAFGAHFLEEALPSQDFKTYQTAVNYQFIHSLGIIMVIAFFGKLRSSQIKTAVVLFLIGMALFCGSLYALEGMLLITGVRYSILGVITPFGGLFFIIGWLYLAVVALKKSNKVYGADS